MKNVYNKNRSASIRNADKRMRMWKNAVQITKRNKLRIKAYVKRRTPKYVKDSKSRPKTECTKIYEKASSRIFMINDEIYVPLDMFRSIYHMEDVFIARLTFRK